MNNDYVETLNDYWFQHFLIIILLYLIFFKECNVIIKLTLFLPYYTSIVKTLLPNHLKKIQHFQTVLLKLLKIQHTIRFTIKRTISFNTTVPNYTRRIATLRLRLLTKNKLAILQLQEIKLLLYDSVGNIAEQTQADVRLATPMKGFIRVKLLPHPT